MAIKYLKKAPKTASTDDAKTREIVQTLLKDLETSKETGCKELTKKFETFHRGELGAPLQPPLVCKGEIVIVVEAPDKALLDWQLGLSDDEQKQQQDSWLDNAVLDETRSLKDLAKELAQKTGWSRKKAYDAILMKRKVTD